MMRLHEVGDKLDFESVQHDLTSVFTEKCELLATGGRWLFLFCLYLCDKPMPQLNSLAKRWYEKLVRVIFVMALTLDIGLLYWVSLVPASALDSVTLIKNAE